MICPNCHNQQSVTEGNYGALYTCKSCQAVYFINFEGQPEFSDVDANAEMSEPLDMSSLPPTNLPDAISSVMDDLPQTNEVAAEINPMQPLVQFSQNDFAAEAEMFQNLGSESSSFSEVAKDISDYGNSETQIAHLNYDLKISGLDTSEVISGLKEAIDDSRFGWDAGEIMRTIRAGEIRFEKLNPVKAYILAKRLRFLNIDKVWTQNAVG